MTGDAAGSDVVAFPDRAEPGIDAETYEVALGEPVAALAGFQFL